MTKKTIDDLITLGVEIEFTFSGKETPDTVRQGLLNAAKKNKLNIYNSGNDGGGFELAFDKLTVSKYKDLVSKEGGFTKFFEEINTKLKKGIVTDSSIQGGMHVHLGWNSFESVQHFLAYVAVATYIFGSECAILFNERFCNRPFTHTYIQEILSVNTNDHEDLLFLNDSFQRRDIIGVLKQLRANKHDLLEDQYFKIINSKDIRKMDVIKSKKETRNQLVGTKIKQSGNCIAVGRKGYATIEHRMFNSTSNIELFTKRLELIVALYKMTIPDVVNKEFCKDKNGIFDYIEIGLLKYKPTFIDIKKDLEYCLKPIELRQSVIKYTNKLLSTVLLNKKMTKETVEKSVTKILERIEA